MKTVSIIFALALAVSLHMIAPAHAVPLSDDLSGYYKFGYTDGNTYAVRAEMGIGALKVYVLPDTRTLYLGIIIGDEIYFVDGFNRPRWGVLRQLDEDTALITSHDADTGDTIEFSVVRITQEEAERIVEESRVEEMVGACSNHLKQIGLALNLFARDHGNELPYDLSELYPTYISDKRMFVCPARGGQFRDFDTDYEYIPGFRVDSPNPDREVVVREVSGNHSAPVDFHFVLYLDGHVQMENE